MYNKYFFKAMITISEVTIRIRTNTLIFEIKDLYLSILSLTLEKKI